MLEWQIVGAGTFSCWLLCWRERCRRGIGLRLCRGEWRCNRRSSLRHLTTDHVVSTDIVKPTTLIFTSVDIKLDSKVFTILDIELFDTILTEKVEDTTLRILAWHFEHIFLRHP